MGAVSRPVYEPPRRRDLPMLRAAVLAILNNAPNLSGWSLQGFGMFRLYLSKEMRLHVWVPSFAVPDVTTIHTHPWHFTSTILSGRMVDKLYQVQPAVGLEATHRRQRIVCGPGGKACEEEPEHVVLALLQRAIFEPGRSYSLTADAAHESDPAPGTVTIIERTFREDTEHAYVFPEVGKPWVSAEPRPAYENEVRAMREIALEHWRNDGP